MMALADGSMKQCSWDENMYIYDGTIHIVMRDYLHVF